MIDRKIVVIGATGSQGRDVVDALVAAEGCYRYTILALAQTLGSPLAQQFVEDYPGVELQELQLESDESVHTYFIGCYGVFVDNAALPDGDFNKKSEPEFDCGKRLASIAKTSGIQHFVYSSPRSISNARSSNRQISPFEHKHRVEAFVKSLSLPATILYPGLSFANFDSLEFGDWCKDTDGKAFSVPKSLGYVGPGHEIGFTARAVFDKCPLWTSKGYTLKSGYISYNSLPKRSVYVAEVPVAFDQVNFQADGKRLLGSADISPFDNGLKSDTTRSIKDRNHSVSFASKPEEVINTKRKSGSGSSTWGESMETTDWEWPPRSVVTSFLLDFILTAFYIHL
ncbi:MAG: hypothetical protein M1827_004245 [Pycnora praestabilis]|nr:MAG: hypothetical protein M1827_004245 [Pycnora praestabilis]